MQHACRAVVWRAVALTTPQIILQRQTTLDYTPGRIHFLLHDLVSGCISQVSQSLPHICPVFLYRRVIRMSTYLVMSTLLSYQHTSKPSCASAIEAARTDSNLADLTPALVGLIGSVKLIINAQHQRRRRKSYSRSVFHI